MFAYKRLRDADEYSDNDIGNNDRDNNHRSRDATAIIDNATNSLSSNPQPIINIETEKILSGDAESIVHIATAIRPTPADSRKSLRPAAPGGRRYGGSRRLLAAITIGSRRHTMTANATVHAREHTVLGAGGAPLPRLSDLPTIVDRDGRITVMCFTWNVAGESKRSLQELSAVFAKIAPAERPCCIGVALQELSPSTIHYHTTVIDRLGTSLGGTHDAYCWVRKWSQMLVIFVRKPLCAFASRPEYKFVATNAVARPFRTKGAIGIAFRLFQTSFVFIACHLTHNHLKNRILDYHKISRTFDFECFRRVGHSATAIVHSHLSGDQPAGRHTGAWLPLKRAAQIFWFGDLNFRVQKCAASEAAAARLIAENRLFRRVDDFRVLINNDELMDQQRKGYVFEDFREGVIRFPPTHKFIIGANKYAQHRIPSYTDRILYWSRSEGAITPLRYDCIWDVTTSDHKPVYCTFKVHAVDVAKFSICDRNGIPPLLL